jgi:hypothetical protein
MVRMDTIELISQPTHGVFEDVKQHRRRVYVAVKSVSRTEYYLSRQIGLNPELIFQIADMADYNGEQLCEYHGKLYDVVRVYYDGLKVELTVEVAKNAGQS